MRSKHTLFLTASAAAMAVALGGCKEEAKKDPNQRFKSVAECETFYGQPCVEENVPYKLTAKSSPMFLSRAACEAAFGAENCMSTSIRSAKARPVGVAENADVDISDPLWENRIEDRKDLAGSLNDDSVLWYPIRRDTASGGSYAYANGSGHGSRYYGGGPHFTYFPIFMNSGGGGYAQPYVASNAARSAMGAPQTPSAGAPASNVGKSGTAPGSTSSIGKGSAPSRGSIGSGASGKAGGFGSTGSGGGSSS